MAFYDFNTNTIGPQLIPPQLRLTVHLAWLRVLLLPGIQYLRDLIFDVYFGGQRYPIYSAFNPYNRGDRVTGYDKALYQCLVNGTVSGLSGPYNDPAWMKIQDNFIGVDERVKYNSQFMVLELALNTFFLVLTTDPDQIYLQTNSRDSSVFVMGQTGETSSAMYNNSLFSTAAMYNDPTFVAFAANFTVFVPNGVLATLGNTAQDQENAIRQFVDKYKLAGLTYLVSGY